MSDIYPIPGFTEPVSCWTHLFAAGVFFILLIVSLVKGKKSKGEVVAISVFGLSCVFLLSMSGVYHLLSHQTTARAVMQRLDHAAIYVLIAGTFSAVHGLLFKGFMRWGIITAIWSAAITGLTLKTIFFNSMPEWLGLTLYLALGWIGAISAVVVYKKYGLEFLKPLLYGGLAYTIGAIIEFIKNPVLIGGVIGPHELFHVAVLVGLAYHWKFVHDAIELRAKLKDV